MNNNEEKPEGCCHHHHHGDHEHGHHHGEGECCCGSEHECECESCGESSEESNPITLIDQETGEEHKAFILFSVEIEKDKWIAYASLEDDENKEEDMTVLPLEIDKDGSITVIDIESDPRSSQLKDIFEDWVNNIDNEEVSEEESENE